MIVPTESERYPVSTQLFDDAFAARSARVIAPGAVHVPNFLSTQQQRFLVDRFRAWAAGPVPARAAKIGEHRMSVRTVCLGWHWRSGGYSRDAVDVNGRRVLPVPDWLVRLGGLALAAAEAVTDPSSPGGTGIPSGAASGYRPDAVLANSYDATASMGMHQDRDEPDPAPVVSLSLGDRCRFRFGNSESRNRPYQDLDLSSGDLFVFGGPARLAFHGVTRIYPGTSPAGIGLDSGRINLTLRQTGLVDPES